MSINALLANFDRVVDTPEAVPKIRRLILNLAVRGKLVPQDPSDEPASELLKKIAKEKERLLAEGEIRQEKPLPSISDAEKLFEVPSGWEWVRLGAVFDVRDGTHTSPKYHETGIPFVTSKNLVAGAIDYSNIKYISKADAQVINQRSKVAANDLLFAMIGTIGNPVIVKKSREFSIKNVALFKPISQFLNHIHYLRFYLVYATPHMKKKARGGNQPFVGLGTLRKYTIPLPPLAEQHRIVAKVNELMALCDKLGASLKEQRTTRANFTLSSLARLTAPHSDAQVFLDNVYFTLKNFEQLTTRSEQIKEIRKAVLNLAVRGKLVPQDPSDEPASELLKKIAKEKKKLLAEGEIRKEKPLPSISDEEKLFAVPSGWEWVRLGDVCVNILSGGTPSTINAAYWNGDIPWITSADIVNTKTAKPRRYITDKAIRESATNLISEGNVIVVTRVGLGKLFRNGFDVCISQDSQGLILNNIVDVDYLVHMLKIQVETFRRISRGATIQGITKGQLSALLIAMPPLAEQHRIVAKVSALMTLCDKLEASLIVQAKIRSHLQSALLVKGVLVA